jgi:glycosyltransferase involved in cell wall biosynthesis
MRYSSPADDRVKLLLLHPVEVGLRPDLLRIAIVTEFFPPYVFGGGELNRYYVAKALVGRGHVVDVFCHRSFGAPKEEMIEGVRVHRLGVSVDAASLHAVRLYSVLELLCRFGGRFDLVDISFFVPYVPAFLLAAVRKIPVVTTVHDIFSPHWVETKGPVWGPIGYGLERTDLLLARNSRQVITVSDTVLQKLVRLGIRRKKIRLCYNGVDLSLIDSVRERRSETPLALAVTRFVKYKHPEHVVLAWRRVIESVRGARLVMIGTGPLLEYCRGLARAVGLEGSVNIMGPVERHEDVLRWMSKAWVLAHASTVEGFGLALVEANACGTPYVAYGIPAVREVTRLTEGGLTVSPMDRDGLARGLVEVLNDVDLRRQLGTTGRRHIERSLTWDHVAGRTEEAYFEALNQR